MPINTTVLNKLHEYINEGFKDHVRSNPEDDHNQGARTELMSVITGGVNSCADDFSLTVTDSFNSLTINQVVGVNLHLELPPVWEIFEQLVEE